MEQRTLSAAYKFYCGKNLEDAHTAEADTRATYEVLMSQLDRYPELQNDVAFLADYPASTRMWTLPAVWSTTIKVWKYSILASTKACRYPMS